MPEQTHSIIIDTNLWISIIINKQFDFAEKLIISRKLIFCDELLFELYNVTKRKNMQKYFDAEDIVLLFGIINKYSKFIKVTSTVDICRDKKDNFLLALARESKADYLITGDNDLLILKEFEGTKIIKITDYRKIIQEENIE